MQASRESPGHLLSPFRAMLLLLLLALFWTGGVKAGVCGCGCCTGGWTMATCFWTCCFCCCCLLLLLADCGRLLAFLLAWDTCLLLLLAGAATDVGCGAGLNPVCLAGWITAAGGRDCC